MKPRLAAILVVSAFSLTALAGCGGGPSSYPEGLGEQCNPQLVSDCGADVWTVHGLRREGHWGFGLTTSSEHSLVIEDFRLVGYEIPLNIQSGGCATCTLTLRDGYVETAESGMGPGSLGIRLFGTWSSILIENVTVVVRSYSSGIHRGFETANDPPTMALHDVRIIGKGLPPPGAKGYQTTTPVGFYYIQLVAGGSVDLRGVDVSGFGAGLGIVSETITADHLAVDNTTRGALLAGAHMTVVGASAQGNVQSGLSLYGARYGPGSAAEVRVRDVRAERNGVGLNVSASTGIDMQGVIARNNGYGLRIDVREASPAAARDIVASDNRYAGLDVAGTGLRITNATLLRNGLGAPDPAAGRSPEMYGGIVAGISLGIPDIPFPPQPPTIPPTSPAAAAIIEASWLEGNVPYGVVTSPGTVVAAADNWWGTAEGPSLTVGPVVVPTGGDAVSSGVQFAPWRTTP